MNRLKTYMAAASAMACLVAPASAAIFTNDLGFHALDGVHVDGIVLAKSLAPAGGSIVDSSNGNLPAVQHGNTQSSTAGTDINGLPAVQHGAGGGGGAGRDRPSPMPRR